jgi:hypothetical protein
VPPGAQRARLGLIVIGSHTALGDALPAGEVLRRFVRVFEAQRVVTVGQARRPQHARVSAWLCERR